MKTGMSEVRVGAEAHWWPASRGLERLALRLVGRMIPIVGKAWLRWLNGGSSRLELVQKGVLVCIVLKMVHVLKKGILAVHAIHAVHSVRLKGRQAIWEDLVLAFHLQVV